MSERDPTVTVQAWSGPLSALSARLGIPPTQLAALLARNARRVGNAYVIDATSDRIMGRVKCLLTRLPEGQRESL